MKVSTFLINCSKAIKDGGQNVITAKEWFDILNFNGGEIFPEISIKKTKTGTIASLLSASSEYQLDMSGETNIESVKEVFVVDASGNEFPYSNWIYNNTSKILDLDPTTSKTQSMFIGNYTSYRVIYNSFLQEFTTASQDIDLSRPKLILLSKICVKEALKQILNDHAKLDRYRVLVSRMNEYALIALIREYTTDIEIAKRKLNDTLPVRSF